MATLLGNSSFTLNGVSNFNIGSTTFTWDGRWIESVDVWSGHAGTPFTATATLSGSNWDIGSLRFGGNVRAIINDTTTAGTEQYINFLRLGGSGGAKVTLTNTGVDTIASGNASVDITTGTQWVGSILAFDGNDIVNVGSGGADMVRVGHGNNTVTTSTSWVASIVAFSGVDTVRIGSAGGGSVFVGSGNNIVTATGNVDSVRADQGNDRIFLSKGAGSIYAGDGQNVVTTGTGSVGSIVTLDGNDRINIGSGGAASVYTGEGNDTVVIARQANHAFIIQMNGGVGADTINFAAYTAGLAISLTTPSLISSTQGSFVLSNFENATGGRGNDTITGSNLANVLNGGAGNDTLVGGRGIDTLTGGVGNDKFRFNAPVTAANADKISDFNVAADTIQLENAVMRGLGTTTAALLPAAFWKSASGLAHDTNDRIIYDTDGGQLWYDANGAAAGGRALIATLKAGLAMTAADFAVI